MNSHMHIDHVAAFGGRTGLLYPEQIRKLLARFAITFSDGYFNLLVSLMDTEPNGEVRSPCHALASLARSVAAASYMHFFSVVDTPPGCERTD